MQYLGNIRVEQKETTSSLTSDSEKPETSPLVVFGSGITRKYIRRTLVDILQTVQPAESAWSGTTLRAWTATLHSATTFATPRLLSVVGGQRGDDAGSSSPLLCHVISFTRIRVQVIDVRVALMPCSLQRRPALCRIYQPRGAIIPLTLT